MGYNAPLEATAKYVRSLSDYGTDEYEKLWKRFEVDENETRSIFTNINRLKIINTAVNDLMVVQSLIYNDHIKAFFPLHNEFDLMGIDRRRANTKQDEDDRMDRKEAATKKNLS